MKRSASENIWLVIKYVLLIGVTILCVHGDYRNSGQ